MPVLLTSLPFKIRNTSFCHLPPATLLPTGIEDDIKIWAPTLPEPRQPGAEAEEVMRSNTAHQGRARRRMVITPQLLRVRCSAVALMRWG